MSDQEKIDYIMDHFDFESVYKTMKALKWTWVMTEEPERTPDLPEIKQFARKLIKKSIESGSKYSSCGGFDVRICEDKHISLFFTVSEFTTETF